jgi:hypothetical protein
MGISLLLYLVFRYSRPRRLGAAALLLGTEFVRIAWAEPRWSADVSTVGLRAPADEANDAPVRGGAKDPMAAASAFVLKGSRFTLK